MIEYRKHTFIIIKFAVIVLLIAVLAVAGLGLTVWISPYFRFQSDLAEQEARVSGLRTNPGNPVDEQSFAGFDLSLADSIGFNDVQFLITHNSYKKNISTLNYKLFSTVTNMEGFHYAHDYLTEQFNMGVRGVELDIRHKDRGYVLYHVKTSDTGSNCPDWRLALEEMRIWSDNNPGHLPISVLVEVKDSALDTVELRELDNSVRNVMGDDKLITPSLLMGGNPNLASVALKDDWVSLADVLGKFMFILHPHDDATSRYIGLDPTLRTQAFVPMFDYKDFVQGNPEYANHYLLIKEDALKVDTVQVLVNSGYMVRVRMDGPDDYKEGNQALAVQTGGQLISTDFEPGVPYPVVSYKGILTGGKTAVLVQNLIQNPKNA